MTYDPKTPGLDPAVQRELQEIRNEFERSQSEFIEFRVHNVAPSKPQQGRVYYADGTNWNPGSGKGLYSYDGSGWVFLEDQDTDTTYSSATTTTEGIIELATTAEVQTGTDTSRAITPDSLRQGMVISGTAQATTSGTAFDFTSIPSWVKKIIVILSEVSLSGTDSLLIQVGDSGGIENTGYTSTSIRVDNAGGSAGGSVTSGWYITSSGSGAARLVAGNVEITNINGDEWVASYTVKSDTVRVVIGGGSKTLSGTLDRVRLTRSGTDTFDNGSVNIMYW